jgi:hypothetical protein
MVPEISGFEKYVFSRPYRWDIKLVKKRDYGVLRYRERGKKLENISDSEFRYAAWIINKASEILKEIDPDNCFRVNIRENEYISEIKLKGDMDYIAGGLALEFLQFSPKVQHMIRWKQTKMFLIGYFIGLLLGVLAMYFSKVG